MRISSARAQAQAQARGGKSMVIGERLRALREKKNLSQGEIEKRTGLLRCYTSRVENGYTVPSVETLEKFARALEVPMYQLFYEFEERPKSPKLEKRNREGKIGWDNYGKEARTLAKLRRMLSHANEEDRKLLLSIARKMAKRKVV
jgi:transcriptional regulator with XRE-family HTH domain